MVEETTLIAITSALTGVLVKGSEVLYFFIKNKLVEEKPDPKIEELINLNKRVYELLSKVDSDSVPLIYTPRRLVSQVDNNNELITGLRYHSEVVDKSMDKLVEAMEQIIRILDKLEYRDSQSNR